MIDREKLRLLEDHHLQMIHETSCRLLEECGIYFEVDEAFDIADQAKLPFDRDSRIIYFPRRVIEDAIHSTPDHFKRKGELKNAQHAVKMSDLAHKLKKNNKGK